MLSSDVFHEFVRLKVVYKVSECGSWMGDLLCRNVQQDGWECRGLQENGKAGNFEVMQHDKSQIWLVLYAVLSGIINFRQRFPFIVITW